MKSLYLSSYNNASGGFIATMAYYALGAGICVGLAQFIPVADMCNPGMPLGVAFLFLAFGGILALVNLGIFLMLKKNYFVRGNLVAHTMVLSGVWLVTAWLTH